MNTQSNPTQATSSSASVSSNSESNNQTKHQTSDSSISSSQKQNSNSIDDIRLWEEGWRERYYQNKFNVNIGSSHKFQEEIVQHYVQGLCWVLQYYYHGVPSWDWYISI